MIKLMEKTKGENKIMNENEKTQIRQADNSVKIEGVLREIKLEEKNDVINGDIIIATDAQSEHAVGVYVNRLTKENKSNRAYSGLQTLMEECKDTSVAALMKEGRTLDDAMEIATKIRIGGRNGGNLRRNEFYANDEFISRPSISANYFNRITDKSYSPQAVFEVECYFEKIRKEIKDDEETGRLLIDVIIPLYGGTVIPFEFVAEGEVAEYIESNYEAKRTGRIWGDIINIVERTVTKKSGFGKDKEDVKVNFTREFLITGGNEEQYDEDDSNTYSTEAIKKAWVVRESETLPALLQKAKERDKDGKSSKGKGKGDNFKF
jgi:hypothetical protein